ncbi:MAG: hypothetical protein ACI8W8_001872 [Rhodothermales bacterium]
MPRDVRVAKYMRIRWHGHVATSRKTIDIAVTTRVALAPVSEKRWQNMPKIRQNPDFSAKLGLSDSLAQGALFYLLCEGGFVGELADLLGAWVGDRVAFVGDEHPSGLSETVQEQYTDISHETVELLCFDVVLLDQAIEYARSNRELQKELRRLFNSPRYNWLRERLAS